MTDLIWHDATNYSQGERGKAPQTAWETDINGHRVWLCCGHRYFPGQWVMNCASFDMRETRVGQTKDMTVRAAQERAIHLLAKKISRIIADAQKTLVAIAADDAP